MHPPLQDASSTLPPYAHRLAGRKLKEGYNVFKPYSQDFGIYFTWNYSCVHILLCVKYKHRVTYNISRIRESMFLIIQCNNNVLT